MKKYITLLGTPLSQSFAARMQNAAYHSMNEELEYYYTECDNQHLKNNIDKVRDDSFLGCAVTKPNKVEVLKYLDELDSLCKNIGSCNTVVKKDGKLVGYNTDALGFYQSIKDEFKIQGQKFFCVGAGGAARAIIAILVKHGAELVCVKDIIEKSAQDLADSFENCIAVKDYEMVKECSVIINASGIGMGSTVGQSPIDSNYIQPYHYCFDACYNPAKTQFLIDAENKGCRIKNGLDMSLYQGVIQINLWTNKEAPVEVMRNELNLILQGK